MEFSVYFEQPNMTPNIDTLFEDERYIKIAELSYTEMIPFVQREFGERTRIIRFYIMLNLLILVLMIIFAIMQVVDGQLTLWQVLSHAMLGGTVIFALLIPLHEALHGLAYKLSGAPSISFGGNLSKFYFYAVADKFVIGKRAFQFVALLPFFVITTLLIILLANVPVAWQWVLWGVLLMHTGGCAGDFGMLSFYNRHGGEVYTFDDVEAEKAYFFQWQGEDFGKMLAEQHDAQV